MPQTMVVFLVTGRYEPTLQPAIEVVSGESPA